MIDLRHFNKIMIVAAVVSVAGLIWASYPKIYPLLHERSLCFERGGNSLNLGDACEKPELTRRFEVLLEMIPGTAFGRSHVTEAEVLDLCRWECIRKNACVIYSVSRPRKWFGEHDTTNAADYDGFLCLVYGNVADD